jgi:hypothetical protein
MANEQVAPAAGAAPVVEAPAAGAEPLRVDTNVGSPNPAGAGERSAPLMARPDWVPEKFFKDGIIDYKGIATSYGELEKSKSKTVDPKAGEPTPKAESKVEDKPISVSVPGIEQARVDAYSAEIMKDGKLSDASYAELAGKGYGKATVDVYLAGLTRDAAVSQAVTDSQVAATHIKEITDGIGGQSALTEMLTWAKSNLSEADLKVYNDSVSSNDPAKVKMAVNGLHHTFTELHGKSPNYLEGERLQNTPGGVAPYESEDAVTKDIATWDYKNNQEFRDKVAARLRVSPNVFARSRDTTKVQR